MNNTKKVLLFFTQNPYPGKTGTHRRCLAAIDAFLLLGYQVTLYSHAHYGPFRWDESSLDYFNGKGVRVELYMLSEADRLFASKAWNNNPGTLNLDVHTPRELWRNSGLYISKSNRMCFLLSMHIPRDLFQASIFPAA